MKAPQKLAGFALGLAVVVGAAFRVGAVLGPETGVVTAQHAQPHRDAPATAVQDAAATELPAGLMSTEDGYTLALAEPRVDAEPAPAGHGH